MITLALRHLLVLKLNLTFFNYHPGVSGSLVLSLDGSYAFLLVFQVHKYLKKKKKSLHVFKIIFVKV